MYSREKGQIQALLAALPISSTAPSGDLSGDPSAPAAVGAEAALQRLPAITAVFAAEAAVALLHSKHFLYRPIDRLLKRNPTLSLQVCQYS